MKTIEIANSEPTLSALLEVLAADGDGDVIIAKDGEPVARLASVGPRRTLKLGLAKGRYPPFDEGRDRELDAQVQALFDQSAAESV